MSKTPTYKSWVTMVWRCSDPRDISYAHYGGRGITVCDRWNPKAGGGFLNFFADMGHRPDGMTLDRIDNNGNYEPANCRWATFKEQAREHSNNGALCSIEGCEQPMSARGLCPRHYRQQWRKNRSHLSTPARSADSLKSSM